MVESVVDVIGSNRLVPVVVIDDIATAGPLAEALVLGGLPVAEVTFRTAAAAAAIKVMADRGDVIVGAGTVLSVQQVDQAVEAGARYIVSPGLGEKVVARCQELGVPVLPGATTATEVQRAIELGLSVVKFFPAGTSGGAPAIKALAAPFPQVSFVPTGGVGPGNLGDYLSIPSVVAVGGSWMVAKDLVVAGKFEEITHLTRDAVALANTFEKAGN